MNRLLKFGEQALKPQYVKGKWKAPLISARIARRLRQEAIISGTYGSYTPEKGGWDPLWDAIPKPRHLRPQKLHKRERTREER